MAGKAMTMTWASDQTPGDLHGALQVLGEWYPLAADRSSAAYELRFTQQAGFNGVRAARQGKVVEVTYDQTSHALRGVSAVMGGLIGSRGSLEQQTPFKTLGIMLDCSRNAVMRVEHLKRWLRQLALLGYNMVMLYTEETYELADEPRFGYLRGRYTAEELREIDDYANALGMEMIGCIQTLGHLEKVLRWPAYNKVRDTSSVLLADEPATYELIDKMIGQFAGVYRSRRIHVGMDETHDLGRGRYMDRFGYRRGFDIFNKHLAKVVKLCKKHGLEPMIWSDMYFRMGSATGTYYDTQAKIPADVVKAIPKEVELVYWDYYHEDQASYEDFIDRHRKLGTGPVMGSGVWTWGLPWHDFDHTRRTAGPCVAACRAKQVEELFFTMWGDGGAYCEFDSAMSGLAYMAELAYGGQATDEHAICRRHDAVCGGDYRAIKAASGLMADGVHGLLWDDPLLRVGWNDRRKTRAQWNKAMKGLERLIQRLEPVARQTKPVDMAHAANVAGYLALKIELNLAVDAAYARQDAATLTAARGRIAEMMRCIDQLLRSFRRQWYRRNKPTGFELIQTRLGGLRQRYGELAYRLGELASGKIDRIDELDESIAEHRRKR